MGRYILNRLLWMIPVILGVLLIAFFLSSVAPGDPVDQILGADAPIEDKEAKREELGLNDPFFVQYGRYVFGIVTRGDLGNSYKTGQPVLKEIISKFPNTFRLTVWAVLVALLIGIPLGVIAAVRQYSVVDNATMVFALFGVSVPQFWFALMMMLIFAVKLKWLPAITTGNGVLGWILPVAMVGIANVGMIARTTRSSMLEVIRQDYIRTARAKGQKEGKVIFKHALRNSLIPVITYAGPQIAYIITGSMVIETIFTVGGLGSKFVSAITNRDYTLIMATTIFLATLMVVANLICDLLYKLVDPRIKYD